MDITEAYGVLQKYYSQTNLQAFYAKKKFDGSETDSYKKLNYNAELLRDVARQKPDGEERKRCFECPAADCGRR